MRSQIYAIAVVLIITNAASGFGGDKPDNSSRRTLMTGDPDSDSNCCQSWRFFCGCNNMVKTTQHKYEHIFPIRTRRNTVELYFNVKADRDANLAFYAEGRKLAYEIILGAKYNTLSSIRKGVGDNVEYAELLLADVVSPNEWRQFWIEITNETVKVGRKYDENVFLELKNVTNVPVKDYSVAGWADNNVLWSLPCIHENDFSW
ncbi:uncharacterized protein LOC135839152 isoform X2 [Planococcus citri]|uniref:uncharacterized protein LOC135839152 isoform X2 n=1 Tax=Planococcus citri TaxID=170843 RepID=UPI0031F951B8